MFDPENYTALKFDWSRLRSSLPSLHGNSSDASSFLCFPAEQGAIECKFNS
ncbi:hypothetical protein PM082_018301 [Marasmius tenuissimus]|nr:hypothetical protein PM082_018301 [Marasmius tenuissimus]